MCAKKSLVIIFLLLGIRGFASHNRAGEITYKRIAPFTQMVGNTTVQVYNYSITVIKYTDESHGSHVVADKCTDSLYFGDGTFSVIDRINGTTAAGCGCGSVPCGVVIITDPTYYVKVNIYTTVHRYDGAGSYLIHTADFARNAGIENIPNSDGQSFYLESLLVINNFTGANSSPEFTYLPIDRACYGKCFYHNPGAFDADGDSLSYEISKSRGGDGNPIPNYTYPNYNTTGIYNINPVTGLLTWCVPSVSQGEYNLAFIVKEWRKNTSGVYQVIGTVLRDMQVVVGACTTNDPPIVRVPQDTCVEAGSTITKKIIFGDPNQVSVVTLEGNGGAFSVASPAATLSNTVFTTSTQTFATADFSWQTTCDHIRQQPYQTIFKATDDGLPSTIQNPIKLVYFSTYNIKVVPPSVKNVTASPQGSSMNITWSLSNCSPANNPITAYWIYRKNDCTPPVYNPCQTGAPAGFSFIGQASSTASLFVDNGSGNGLTVGQDYSYIVIAVYKDGSQSFGSSAVCARLKRDVPVILNVDILSTSATAGSVFVRWNKPLTNVGNLDTLIFPGPYQFNLKYRALPSGTFATVYNFTSPYFLNLSTQFTHTAVNTIDSSVEYQVEFIAGTTTVGASQRASSVYLNTIAGDRHINLQWNSSTPWNNYLYTVYRKSPSASAYSVIGTTSLTSYNDTVNVVNRATYCYKVLSSGQYSDPSIQRPLLNNSQEVCATAVDLTPPCSPTISINADCPTGIVEVSWTDVKPICSDDVVKYILSYKPTISEDYKVIATLTSTLFIADGLELISGCYAVQAVDSSNNVSSLSPDFCIDNCPEFELPNIITLNGDGVNDFYKAIKVRQIKEIDLVIFDRWGNMVYKTRDPYFKWDGTSIQTKQLVSAGTFFYICDVFEPHLKGITKRNLKGYMQVIK